MNEQRITDRSGNAPCASIQERFALRHDGETVAQTRSADDAHVATCAVCARFIATLQRTAPLFDAARELEARPRIEARLRAAVAARTAARPRGVWTLRLAAGFVGFLTVFAIARAVGTGARSDRAPERGGPHAIDRFVGATRALTLRTDALAFPESALLARFSAIEDER